MKLLIIFSVVLLIDNTLSLNDSYQTIVKKCKESSQIPEVAIVSNGQLCVQPPCIAIPGTVAQVTINFTSPGYVPSITPRFMALYAGLNIDYPTGQKDACDGIQNTACPLGEGEFTSYIYDLTLKSWFPPVAVSLEVSLINDDEDQLITCFAVDLQVKSS